LLYWLLNLKLRLLHLLKWCLIIIHNRIENWWIGMRVKWHLILRNKLLLIWSYWLLNRPSLNEWRLHFHVIIVWEGYVPKITVQKNEQANDNYVKYHNRCYTWLMLFIIIFICCHYKQNNSHNLQNWTNSEIDSKSDIKYFSIFYRFSWNYANYS